MNLTQTLRGRQHYQKKLCADWLCSQQTDGKEGHFPVNSTSLLFFSFPLLLLSRFSWPLCTHAHVSAWLWRVNNSVLEKDPLWNARLPFYLNDESGKLPRWNIYYTKCILLKRKLTRDTPGNYMYLQYVDPVFFFLLLWNICEWSCQHFWPMTGYLKSDIWISDMCISVYIANEPSSQDVLKSQSQFPDLMEMDRKLDFYWLVFVKY